MCQFLVLMVYVSIPSIDGLLVNSSCCSTGDLSTARLLLNEDNVSDTTDTGLSLLHISCISGGTQSVCQPLCLPVCVCISVCLLSASLSACLCLYQCMPVAAHQLYISGGTLTVCLSTSLPACLTCLCLYHNSAPSFC